MASYMLDTNHVSRLFAAEHPVHQRVLSQLEQGDEFFICVPVLTEVLFGIGLLPRVIQNRKIWNWLKPNFPCYVIDESDAEIAAELQVSLKRTGHQLKTVDALIAAVTLRYELTLLTTDQDFGSIPGLYLENWLQP